MARTYEYAVLQSFMLTGPRSHYAYVLMRLKKQDVLAATWDVEAFNAVGGGGWKILYKDSAPSDPRSFGPPQVEQFARMYGWPPAKVDPGASWILRRRTDWLFADL